MQWVEPDRLDRDPGLPAFVVAGATGDLADMDPRMVSAGGLHFETIECIGNRVFIKDMGRLMEYHPKTGRYEALAWGQFWDFLDGKSHQWGPRVYEPDRVDWTKSVSDITTIPFGKIGRLTPDGKRMICAGAMAASC